MKITLTRNIGTTDLRNFGLLSVGDPEELRKALDTYAKDKTVDVPAPFHEYLLKRGLGEVKGVAPAAAITGVSEESPVHQSNVADAVDTISRMTSKDKLQHVIDNDPRATVKEAAKKRLASL